MVRGLGVLEAYYGVHPILLCRAHDDISVHQAGMGQA